MSETKSLSLAYSGDISAAPPEPEPQAPAVTAATGQEPRPSHPAVDGPVVCRSCGQANVAGTWLCSRATCRRTLKGNGISRTTSLYAANNTPEARAIEDAGQALAEQSIVDAGGREELAARELSDHQYRGLLHVRILKLAHALNTHGDFDKRGRLRKGWIELLERLIASAVSIDKTLGLPRRAKRIDLAQAFAEHERGGDRG